MKNHEKIERSRKAVLAGFIIAAALMIGGVLLASGSMKAERERDLERADLYAMRNAELDVQRLFREKGPEQETEFWYDPNAYRLIPVTEEMPAPSGMGTGRAGGGKAEFMKETGVEYAYDESRDYTDKIIRIVVQPDLTCEVTWISAE